MKARSARFAISLWSTFLPSAFLSFVLFLLALGAPQAHAQSGIIPTDPSVNRIDWAASSRGASISGGTSQGDWPLTRLIDERESGIERYSTLVISSGESHVIDLSTNRTIHTLQLRLYDGDDRYFRYRVDYSIDGETYSPLIDRTTGEHRSVQRVEFPLTNARYIKITGTFSSVNNAFHLIDEILVIGDESATPEEPREVAIDGRLNAGGTYTPGSVSRLHAGIYEIEHLSGAVSSFADDAANGGRTWEGRFHISVPVSNKVYSFGFVHNRLSRFPTATEAEASVRNQAFTIYLPVESEVFFWFPDSSPGDNRGSHLLRVRQLSGPNDSLLTRVRDSMTRSVLWQQKEVAEWSSWVTNPGGRDCFGCHIQTQASVGLNDSALKVAGLPISSALTNEFVDAYQTWIASGSAGNVTETSLWNWGVSSYHGPALEALTPALLNGLNWIRGQQQANGGWNATHTDGNGAKLYYDGTPSAAHTAGNIQAFATALNTLAEGGQFIPYQELEINGATVNMLRNYGVKSDVRFTPVENVTAVRITINNSFHTSGNFVLTELQAFGQDELRVVHSSEANFSQSGYPITEAHNGILVGTSDGWAYAPRDPRTDPAVGVFVFNEPVSLDRIRISHAYLGAEPKTYRLEVTNDPSPTLLSTFTPLAIQDVGRFEGDVGGLPAAFTQSLRNAANLLSSTDWAYGRNTRTAAQTVIGLFAALPFLEGSDAQAALARIQQADAWLRARQHSEGGWSDASDGSGVPRIYQSAQALRALLLIGSGELDSGSLRGAEFLLREQDTDGAWTSPPLDRRLAATTWVEIALPTLFDRLSEAYRQNVIDDLAASGQLNAVELTWSPIPEASSYNIYRRLESGQYQLIRQNHVTEVASYLDEGLVNEVTYYYVVRWVNDRGVESADSNEASGTPYGLICGADSPPRITSRAVTGATTNAEYRYQVEATDPDPDEILTFSLTSAPSGMNIIPSSGLITWTPSSAQEGSHFVRIKVEDRIGRFATQAYRIFVAPIFVNQAPRFVSSPVRNAIVGYPYLYRARAIDPNTSDIVTYLLDQRPSGMNVNSTTGSVGWRPTPAQVGPHDVQLTARDLGDLSDSQPYSVNVVGNQPPEISSQPNTRAPRRRVYVYNVVASDPENGTLTYTLDTAPAGMSIHRQTGRVLWAPTEDDTGIHAVAIRVADPAGAVDTQGFNLEVPENEAPVITSLPPTRIGTSQPYSYQVRASDPEQGPLTYALLRSPTGMSITPSGLVQWGGGAVGDYQVEVEVRDNHNVPANQPYTLEVRDGVGGGEEGAPTVTIETPEPASEIRVSTPIIATIADQHPHGDFTWEFELRRDGEESGVVIGEGANSVTSTQVGVIDPTALANDSYYLWAHVTKGARTYSYFFPYLVNSQLKWGAFQTSVNDLTVPLTGVSIDITRQYSSIDTAQYQFGHGWRLKLPGKVVDSAPEEPFQSLGTTSRVFVTRPDGKRVGFTFAPYQISPLFPIYMPYFRPDAGVTDSLDVDGTALFISGGEFYELFGQYNPSRYYLTTRDRIRYTIDEEQGLLEIRDANRNTISFTNNAITSSTGVQILVQRDANGNITQITDPRNGQLRYAYDAAGDLISFTNQLNQVWRYAYDAGHKLLTITDPESRVILTNVYDSAGRLIRQLDADGRAMEITTNPLANTEVIRDRRGNFHTYKYDVNGNLIEETDALGGVKRFSYDANYNLLSETDQLGHTTTFTYDSANNLLTKTDPLGGITRYTYNSLGQVTSETNPLGVIRLTTYDESGNILTETDAAGRIKQFAYNGAGQVTSLQDRVGNVAQFAYNGTGGISTTTAPSGHTTRYSYNAAGTLQGSIRERTKLDGTRESVTSTFERDAQGQLTRFVNGDGREQRITSNPDGLPTEIIDPSGRSVHFAYSPYGELLRTDFADGSAEIREYDATGNLQRFTDRTGRSMRFEYDVLNRVIAEIEPNADGTGELRRATEYDAAGRITAQIDEAGRRMTFAYDAAGRQTSFRDGLNNEWRYEYDLAGNLISITDPEGRIVTYAYDHENRLTREQFSDSTTILYAYDAEGRLTRRTNQAGETLEYAYNEDSQLIRVTDPAGGQIRYEYDELGNVIRETDALGRVTQSAFNRSGDIVQRILPGGQSETYAYNSLGDVTTRTKFDGRQIRNTYAADGNTTQQQIDGGESYTFGYSTGGVLDSVTSSLGETAYELDSRGYPARTTFPDGSVLSYSFSGPAQLAARTTPAGTTQYDYDAAGRLSRVRGPGGIDVHYSYDRSGLVTGINYGNGTRAEYSYDSLARPVRVRLLRGASTISDLVYTLDSAGRRTAIQSGDGSIKTYRYDLLGRVTEERVVPAVGATSITAYTYDLAGNRTQRVIDGMTTTYTYDANDRLTQAGTRTFISDASGNLTGENAGATAIVSYIYDAADRLVRATRGSAVMEFRYDSNNLLQQIVHGAITKWFLTDFEQKIPQFVEERSSDGNNKAFVIGDRLLAARNGADTEYVHGDLLGSTIGLSDPTGSITDTYSYDAFGQLIAHVGDSNLDRLFTGEISDEVTGGSYLRSRFYRPDLGRFLSRDSAPYTPNYPLEFNRYVYAANNPVLYTDPLGYTALSEAAVLRAQIVQRIAPVIRCLGGVILTDVAETGLYLLIGELSSYVGQSKHVQKRVRQHALKGVKQILDTIRISFPHAVKQVHREALEQLVIEILEGDFKLSNTVRRPVGGRPHLRIDPREIFRRIKAGLC